MSIPKEKADYDLLSADEADDVSPAEYRAFQKEAIRLLRKIAGE